MLVLALTDTKFVLWSFFGGEDGSAQAQAREAPLLKSGGDSKESLMTNEQQPLCHASPGRDQGEGQRDGGDGVLTRLRRTMPCLKGVFASAESQGYRN